MYMPIKALNTFTRDWKIQARVSQKGEKRVTKNGGSLLKINFIDMYGTKIEAAFFDEAADHFDKKISEGKVYLVSNGTVKMANKKFTSIKNDFCLIFEKNAQIIETEDDGSIASLDSAFDFNTIKSLEE
jgi:replication factor A1